MKWAILSKEPSPLKMLIRAFLRCRENGFQDDLAYGELMVTKLGLTQLTKQFDIATGYAEPDPEPYQYQPKTDKPAQ